jgi:hypothetical protein
MEAAMSADAYEVNSPYEEDEDYGEPCHECDDEGWILDDCFEDTCCCADPEVSHGYIPCPVCMRKVRP